MTPKGPHTLFRWSRAFKDHHDATRGHKEKGETTWNVGGPVKGGPSKRRGPARGPAAWWGPAICGLAMGGLEIKEEGEGAAEGNGEEHFVGRGRGSTRESGRKKLRDPRIMSASMVALHALCSFLQHFCSIWQESASAVPSFQKF